MEPADVERELRGLAERVKAIEDRLGFPVMAPGELRPPAVMVEDHGPAGGQLALERLGIGSVGVGVAYVLRALVESGSLAAGAGIAAGIVYATAWMAAAARRGEAIYALTSALVIAPLLWEATLRFHVVAPWMAAAILLGFTLFGLGISWRRNLLSVATISTIAGLGTAAALLVGTRDVVPFTVVFLAVAAAVEVSACLEHWLAERWLAAAAADVAVLLATWLATNPRGLPPEYAPIPHGWLVGAQIALLGTYLASTIVRTLVRRFTVTAFETAQCAAAFAIAMWSGLPLGGPMLGAGAACYVVSFVVLERGGGRNFYTYSTFGLLLALAGSTALLAGTGAAVAWSGLAIACAWSRRLTLQVHGAIYLALALTLAAPLPAVAVAGVCYAGAARGPLRIPLFGAAAWTVAVFAASVAPDNLRLAAKLLICGAALILLPRIRAVKAPEPASPERAGQTAKAGAAAT